MRIIYSVFLLLAFTCSQSAFAQKHLEDSLLIVLKNHPQKDVQHLKTLNALSAAQIWMINAESIASANKAIALAKKLNNQQELANAFNNKASALLTVNLPEAFENAQKALEINTSLNNISGIVQSHSNLANILYNQGEMEKNQFHTQKALELSEQIDNPLLKGTLYMFVGSFNRNDNMDSALICFRKAAEYFDQAGNPDFSAFNMLFIGNTYGVYSINDSALIYLNKSFEIGLKTGSLRNISNAYGTLGIFYMSLGDFPKSATFFIKALKIAEQRKDKFDECISCVNIGYIYCQLKQYEESMKYSEMGLALATELNNPELMCGSYEGIGDVHFARQNFDFALETYKKGLEIANGTNVDSYMAILLGHIGETYEKLNQHALALINLQKAIEINKKAENNSYLSRNYISIGNTIRNASASALEEVGINPIFRHQISIDFFEKALLLNQAGDELEVQRDALNGISNLYANQKDFKKALTYFKQYSIIKDSMVNNENSNIISNLQIEYESEKQQQQIFILQKDKDLHHTEIQSQKMQRNSILGGFILVLVLIGFTVNAYLTKSKSNAQIERTVAHLQLSQQQLVEQGKLAALGKMTSDVALRIKEPIGKIEKLSPIGESLVIQYENAISEAEKDVILKDLKKCLDEINNCGLQANNVVKDVLMQSRK